MTPQVDADPLGDPDVRAVAQRRVAAARVWVARHRPYYTKALLACPLVFTGEVPTLAIDPEWRIYVNPAYTASLSVEEASTALLHELNHGLRAHKERADKAQVPNGCKQVWNVAGDCEINDDLDSDGLSPREEWVYPHTFDMQPGGLAEGYYSQLLDNAIAIEVEVWCCGSGAGGVPGEFEQGDSNQGKDGPAVAVDGIDPLQREVLRKATAEAVNEHHRHNGWGSVPEGLRRWAGEMLRPEVDWRRVLASEVRRSLHNRPGIGDYTWSRPPRRPDTGPAIRPGSARPAAQIAVVIDTSGSMGEHDLARALTETQAILTKAVPGEAVAVYSVDADVAAAQTVFNTRQIDLAGGGGTDMGAGIEVAARKHPDAIIVITDGYTPWPPIRPPGNTSTVIAVLTQPWTARNVPAWIKAIVITRPDDPGT